MKNDKRRKALKALAIGAPAAWAKPVVDSMVLPVHAAMTGAISGGGGAREEFAKSSPLLDYLVPQAHAAGKSSPGCISIQYQLTGDMVTNVVVVIVTQDKCGGTEKNLAMTNTAGNEYVANGTIFDPVKLIMTNPMAGPGEKFGECYVKERLPFDVFRGETCVEDGIECDESDSRLKTDIHSLGKTGDGINIYRFKYLSDETQTDYVGVMAQDLLDTRPHALVIGEDGFYRVKYGELGMRMAKYNDYANRGMESINLLN